MNNPLYSMRQIIEYIIFGAIAAAGFLIFLMMHLHRGSYESMYLLYIGNAVFGAVILVYNLLLIRRSYLKQRAVSMLLAAHFATAVGTVISIVFTLIATSMAAGNSMGVTVVDDAPAHVESTRGAAWVFMVVVNALILNFSAGSFASIVTSYAGKRNQKTDAPAHLGRKAGDGWATNDAP
jgi:hypothetical protein